MRQTNNNSELAKIKNLINNIEDADKYELFYSSMVVSDMIVKCTTPSMVIELQGIKEILSNAVCNIPEDVFVYYVKSGKYKDLQKTKYKSLDDGVSFKKAYRVVSPIESFIFRILKLVPVIAWFIITLVLRYYAIKNGMQETEVGNATLFLVTLLIVGYAIILCGMFAHAYIKYRKQKLSQFEVTYYKVTDNSRIKRNHIWLNTMIEILRNKRSSGEIIDDALLKDLLELRIHIEDSKQNSYEYCISYAKVEKLRDDYLRYVEYEGN